MSSITVRDNFNFFRKVSVVLDVEWFSFSTSANELTVGLKSTYTKTSLLAVKSDCISGLNP